MQRSHGGDTSGCGALARGLCVGPAAPQPVQMRLLQFLGSSDPTGRAERAEGGTWLGYLSQLKLAPRPPKAPAGTVAASSKAGS